MNLPRISELLSIVAVVMAVVGLRRMTTPTTYGRANTLVGLGLWLVVVAALLRADLRPGGILMGLGMGALAGWLLVAGSRATALSTLMPLLAALGALSSTLVASAAFWQSVGERHIPVDISFGFALATATAVGAAGFATGLVIFWRLRGAVPPPRGGGIGRKERLQLGAAVMVGLVLYAAASPGVALLSVVLMAGLAYGAFLSWPILNIDLPPLTALTCMAAGVAAAACGMVLALPAVVALGGVVATASLGLARVMLRTTQRDFLQMWLGTAAPNTPGNPSPSGEVDTPSVVRPVQLGDLALQLAYARRVILVPGYGMAVAQAQHAVKDVITSLQARGVQVKVAIHPVAGRLPGHMNVLLSEANIPYDLTFELERINPEFRQADVVLVVGANDVVNPDARDNQASPLFGMAILEADRARSVVVLKRGQGRGYSGQENPLFGLAHTTVLLGDARTSLIRLNQALQEVS